MKEAVEIFTLVGFFILIFDYFKEVNKILFYISCWICIGMALYHIEMGGGINYANLLIAFLVFMTFNQRRKREKMLQSQTEEQYGKGVK